MLAAMRAYVTTDRCRRAILLRYFDDSSSGDSGGGGGSGGDDRQREAGGEEDEKTVAPANCSSYDNCLAPNVALTDRLECTVEA